MRIFLSLLLLICFFSSAQNWTSINGPTGGSILKISMDANNNIYALISETGSLYVSKNGGAEWSLVSGTLNWLHGIEVDGTTVYANSWQDFYVSTDAGVTWTKKDVTSFKEMSRGLKLFKEAGILLMYGLGGAWISSDGGEIWKKIYDKEIIDVISNSSGDLFIAVPSVGILKQNKPANFDGWDQSKWNVAFSKQVSGTDYNLSIGYHQPWNKYLMTYRSPTNGQNIFMQSNDSGATWSIIPGIGASTASPSRWFSFTGQDKFFYTLGNTIYSLANGSPITFTARQSPGITDYDVISIYYKNSAEIYSGTNGDGFWKSADDLASWELKNGTPPRAIMATPLNDIDYISGKLIVIPSPTTPTKGYWASINLGSSWEWVKVPFSIYTYTPIKKLRRLQDNSFIIKGNDGVYRTTDGINWSKILNENVAEVLPSGLQDLYAFSYNGTIQKSSNAGQTWTTISVSGMPANIFLNYAALDGSNFYLGLITSDNKTQYWRIRSNTTPIQATQLSVDLSTKAYEVSGLFTFKNKLYIGDYTKIAYSSDQGNSFNYINYNHVQIMPIDQGAGGLGISIRGSLIITPDDGKSFSSSALPLPNSYITSVNRPTETSNFFASAIGSPVLRFLASDSLIKNSSSQFIDFGWTPTDGPDGGGRTKGFLRTSDGTLFVSSFSSISKFSTISKRWEAIERAPLYYHGATVYGNDLYVLNFARLSKSSDKGQTFTILNENLFSRAVNNNNSIYKDPDNGTLFILTEAGLYRSTDDGKTVSTVNLNSFFDLRKVGNRYIAISKSNSDYAILSSTDGVIWTPSSSGVDLSSFGQKTSNFLDVKSNVTILTTEKNIYRSTDGGNSWSSIKSNLTETSFGSNSKTYFSPAGDYYFVNSGYPSKLYVSRDQGQTWTLRTTTNGAVKFVDIKDLFWDGNQILAASGFRQGVLVSADDGITFDYFEKNSGLTSFSDFQGNSELRISAGQLSLANSTVISVSTDQGKTWTNTDAEVSRFLDLPDGKILAFSGRLFESTDNGLNWTKITMTQSSTKQDLFLTRLVSLPGNNFLAYGGVSGSSTQEFYTSTNLKDWTPLTLTGLPALFNVDHMQSLGDKTFLILNNPAVGATELYQISNGVVKKLFIDSFPRAVVAKDGKLYLLSGNGFIYSSTDGISWVKRGCPSGASILIFANNGYIFLSGLNGLLWVSRDGGISWQNVSMSGVSSIFNSIAIDPTTGIAFGAQPSRVVYKSSRIVILNDKVGPKALSFSPTANLENVPITGLKLTINFDEAPKPVTGKKIRIYKSSASQTPVETIDVSTGVISDFKVTFNINSTLSDITKYFVNIDPGAFTDLFDNPYSGISSSSDWSFTTLDATSPSITFVTSDIDKGQPKVFEITVTDNKAVNQQAMKIFYRGITKPESQAFQSTAVSASTGATPTSLKATVTASDSWYDAVGLEFYFEVEDESGNKKRSPAETDKYYYSYIKYPLGAEPKVEGVGFGGTLNSYRIISVPFKLQSSSIEEQFDELGSPDRSSWRMFTYAGDNKYQEVAGGGLSTLTRGVGYWINVKDFTDIKLNGASSPENNRTKFFSINLKAGWNQIGNPYPVAISWSEATSGKSGIGPLKKYLNGVFSNGTSLSPFEGGFVFVNTAQTLNIGFPGVSAAARISGEEKLNPDPSKGEWIVPIILEQGGIRNEFPGIGMMTNASMGFDQFDDLDMPVFDGMEKPEMFSAIKKDGLNLTKDVLPVHHEGSWRFKVKTSGNRQTLLTWSITANFPGDKDLFLFDTEFQRLINMTLQNQYQLPPDFKGEVIIYFGNDLEKKIKPTLNYIGDLYPNPLNSGQWLSFPTAFLDDPSNPLINIQLLDSNGKSVEVLNISGQNGFGQVQVKLPDDLRHGLYLIKVNVQHAGNRIQKIQRLIIE